MVSTMNQELFDANDLATEYRATDLSPNVVDEIQEELNDAFESDEDDEAEDEEEEDEGCDEEDEDCVEDEDEDE